MSDRVLSIERVEGAPDAFTVTFVANGQPWTLHAQLRDGRVVWSRSAEGDRVMAIAATKTTHPPPDEVLVARVIEASARAVMGRIERSGLLLPPLHAASRHAIWLHQGRHTDTIVDLWPDASLHVAERDLGDSSRMGSGFAIDDTHGLLLALIQDRFAGDAGHHALQAYCEQAGIAVRTLDHGWRRFEDDDSTTRTSER